MMGKEWRTAGCPLMRMSHHDQIQWLSGSVEMRALGWLRLSSGLSSGHFRAVRSLQEPPRDRWVPFYGSPVSDGPVGGFGSDRKSHQWWPYISPVKSIFLLHGEDG